MNKVYQKIGYKGKPLYCIYKKFYIIRRVTEDGLLKHFDKISEYFSCETEEEAIEKVAENDLNNAIILTRIEQIYVDGPDGN